MAKRIDPKADRKHKLEELKRQQQAKERRKTMATVGIAMLLGLGLVGAVVVPAVLKDRRESNKAKAAEREASRPLADFGAKLAAADCSPEAVDNPIPPGGSHKGVGERVEYAVAPPSGGEHQGDTAPPFATGFHPTPGGQAPTAERAVHSLEHGVVVGWYDKALPAAEVDVLRKVAASSVNKRQRFIAVPWDRADFADNKHFVLTSWGHTQRCGKVSGEAVDAFVKKNADSKDAPEAGAAV